MSYVAGETQVVALLQAMPQFGRANVARADWKALNSGASDHYAIAKPGPWTNSADGLNGEALTEYRTVIELWQRWVDDSPTVQALEALTQAVVEHLERYPSLAGASLMAGIAGGSEVQQRWLKEGGPLWAVQEVYLDWQEERFYDAVE